MSTLKTLWDIAHTKPLPAPKRTSEELREARSLIRATRSFLLLIALALAPAFWFGFAPEREALKERVRTEVRKRLPPSEPVLHPRIQRTHPTLLPAKERLSA